MFFGKAGAPTESRTVQPGQPGDLCLLSVSPTEALAELDAQMVLATVVAGALVYG